MLLGRKYFILFFIVFLFKTDLFASVQIKQIGNQTSYHFSIDFLETKNNLGPQLKGIDTDFLGIHYEIGSPKLPTINVMVQANKLEDIQVVLDNSSEQVISLINGVKPAEESLVKLPSIKRKQLIRNEMYFKNEYYPNKNYTITYSGSVRGQKQYLVKIFPLRFNPLSEKGKLVKNISVMATNTSKKMIPLAQKTILFVIGDAFSEAHSLLEYLKLKETLGYRIEKIVVNQELSSPDAIRNKIRELYFTETLNLTDVVIVGDIEDVPSKSGTYIHGVTDHYYRAIDTERYIDDINGPDVGVGRLTVKTIEELDVVIAKLTKYSNDQFSNNGWKRKVSFIATNDRYEVAEKTHNYAIDNYTEKEKFFGTFPQARMLGGDRLYAITHNVSDDQVVERVNEGRTIVNYSGHGAFTYWAGPEFTQENVRNLTHQFALPFVISNACITGDFRVRESFGETWIKAEHGAIMFWGSMDNTYWDEDDILEKKMYDGIFSKTRSSFSQITQYALGELWKYYGGEGRSKYYWETYVTFGDPSLDLRL